jgi:DNA-binding MarR family transcriptional regulator
MINARDAARLAEVLNLLPSLYFHLRERATSLHGADDLTPGQRSLLVDVAATGMVALSDLTAARPGISRQYIHRLLTELRSAGLLRAGRDIVDKRRKPMTLTAKGARLVERIREQELAYIQAFAPDFTDAELATTASVLRRILGTLKDSRELP